MPNTAKRFAHEVVVDHPGNEVRIDGVSFPYYVEPEPQLEIPHDEGEMPFAILRIGVFAESVTYIAPDGEPRRLLEASPQAHSEWARRRAREIVYDGMADVIAWFRDAKEAREDAVAEAYQAGMQRGIASQLTPVPPPMSLPAATRRRPEAADIPGPMSAETYEKIAERHGRWEPGRG